MPTHAHAWPGTTYEPVVELGYPYELGPEYRYDTALYDTTGRYGPWWIWDRVECEVSSVQIVRGSSSPSQRPSSATATVQLVAVRGDGSLSPWWRDPTGVRQNRANLPARVAISDGTTTWPLFSGWVDTWTEIDDPSGPSITLTCSDGFKHLALNDQGETTPQGAGEAAGARIGRILDRAGWMAGRDLSPGTIALQATTLARPALEEIYLTADTEAGIVWVDTAGAFRFVDRDWLRQKSEHTNWRLGDRQDDPDAVCVTSFISTADDMDVENVIGLSRVGGTASWLEDSASISKYGRRAWSRFDLPYAEDTDTPTLLAIQLADRSAREYHMAAAIICPTTEPDAWPVTLGVDLYDTVYVTRRRGPDHLAEIAGVIGIEHELTPGEVTTVLSLGPPIRQTLARYDVDLYDVARYSAT